MLEALVTKLSPPAAAGMVRLLIIRHYAGGVWAGLRMSAARFPGRRHVALKVATNGEPVVTLGPLKPLPAAK